jgi:hypothetical protein
MLRYPEMHHNFLKKPLHSTVQYCAMLIRVYKLVSGGNFSASPSPILLENIARSKTAGRLLSFLHLHTGSRGYLGNPTNMSRSYLGNPTNMSRSFLGNPINMSGSWLRKSTNLSKIYLGKPTNMSRSYLGNPKTCTVAI